MIWEFVNALARLDNRCGVEYRFDYTKAKRNRFADRLKPGSLAIILDPDVASVFRSSGAVNTFLRSVITTLPERSHKRTKTG